MFLCGHCQCVIRKSHCSSQKFYQLVELRVELEWEDGLQGSLKALSMTSKVLFVFLDFQLISQTILKIFPKSLSI